LASIGALVLAEGRRHGLLHLNILYKGRGRMDQMASRPLILAYMILASPYWIHRHLPTIVNTTRDICIGRPGQQLWITPHIRIESPANPTPPGCDRAIKTPPFTSRLLFPLQHSDRTFQPKAPSGQRQVRYFLIYIQGQVSALTLY